MDINKLEVEALRANLVPIALGKYLFPFRTQKSSPVAAIILQLRETSKVPNYTRKPPKRVAFRLSQYILTFLLKCAIIIKVPKQCVWACSFILYYRG